MWCCWISVVYLNCTVDSVTVCYIAGGACVSSSCVVLTCVCCIAGGACVSSSIPASTMLFCAPTILVCSVLCDGASRKSHRLKNSPNTSGECFMWTALRRHACVGEMRININMSLYAMRISRVTSNFSCTEITSRGSYVRITRMVYDNMWQAFQ